MQIEKALYQFLRDHPEVGGFFNEIEFVELAEGADFPQLIITAVSSFRDSDIRASYPRFQLDIYTKGKDAAAYSQIQQGASIVKNALDKFKGSLAGKPVEYIYLENQRDMPTQEEPLRRKMQEYKIIYKEE